MLTSCHQQGSSKEGEEDRPYGHIFTNYYNRNTTTNTQPTEEVDPTKEGRLGNTDMEPDEDMTMKGVEQEAGGGTNDSRTLTEALRKAYLSSTGNQVEIPEDNEHDDKISKPNGAFQPTPM